MTGWRRDEVIGRTPEDTGVWVEPEQRRDIVKRLLSSAPVRNVALDFRAKNGEIRRNLGSASCSQEGG
jgi:PAS domain-containing protein